MLSSHPQRSAGDKGRGRGEEWRECGESGIQRLSERWPRCSGMMRAARIVAHSQRPGGRIIQKDEERWKAPLPSVPSCIPQLKGKAFLQGRAF